MAIITNIRLLDPRVCHSFTGRNQESTVKLIYLSGVSGVRFVVNREFDQNRKGSRRRDKVVPRRREIAVRVREEERVSLVAPQ